jgi:hypothetical protein
MELLFSAVISCHYRALDLGRDHNNGIET